PRSTPGATWSAACSPCRPRSSVAPRWSGAPSSVMSRSSPAAGPLSRWAAPLACSLRWRRARCKRERPPRHLNDEDGERNERATTDRSLLPAARLERGRPHGAARESHREGRSIARGRRNLHAAAVAFGDLLDDEQAQPQAARAIASVLRAPERVEQD